MRKIFTLMLVIGLMAVTFFAAYSNALDIYTFKKDRVDQDLSTGNRGYISGTAPVDEKKRNLKRTLIGVDIELTDILGDDEYDEYDETDKEEAKKPESQGQAKMTIEREVTKPAEKEPIKEGAAKNRKKVETEEDWIK